MINGLFCHESGCPTAWKHQKVACKECGCDFIRESKNQCNCPDCTRDFNDEEL